MPEKSNEQQNLDPIKAEQQVRNYFNNDKKKMATAQKTCERLEEYAEEFERKQKTESCFKRLCEWICKVFESSWLIVKNMFVRNSNNCSNTEDAISEPSKPLLGRTKTDSKETERDRSARLTPISGDLSQQSREFAENAKKSRDRQ